jgi:hypothetical protein
VRMRDATHHHTQMARELSALREVVSSTTELVLGHSPNETSQVEIMNELVDKFWRREELCSRLEGPSARIYDLFHGPVGAYKTLISWTNMSNKCIK